MASQSLRLEHLLDHRFLAPSLRPQAGLRPLVIMQVKILCSHSVPLLIRPPLSPRIVHPYSRRASMPHEIPGDRQLTRKILMQDSKRSQISSKPPALARSVVPPRNIHNRIGDVRRLSPASAGALHKTNCTFSIVSSGNPHLTTARYHETVHHLVFPFL